MNAIERLDDLESLDLAPPLVLAAAGDVLGEELDAGDDEAVAITEAIRRLKRMAQREAWAEFETGHPDRGEAWSNRKQARMTAIWEESFADVTDLVNLALARLRGEGLETESEDDMATTAVAKRTTKPRSNGTPAAEAPAGLCVLCSTAIGVGVEACPACGGRDRRAMAKEPLPSSLAPLNGEALPRSAAAVDQVRQISVERIDPSPYQRRRAFDETALEQLSASIVEHGLLHPIVVRAVGERYELIAGERRLRATQLAGYATIAATVRNLTDAQAAEACATENLDRQDLNAIEEAETLKVLLDVGRLTQSELAQRLNRSQPWIANRLRLLELPADWRERIISQEIPPTHARELLAWQHRPAVLKKAAKELKDRLARGDAAVPSVEEFRRRLQVFASDLTKTLTVGWECHFKPTKAQREELDIETIESSWRGKEERAWNVKLWGRLEKEAREKETAATATAKAASNSSRKEKPAPPSDWAICSRITPWLAREVGSRLRKSDRDHTLRLLLLLATGAIESPMTDMNSSHPIFKREIGDRLSALRAWRSLIDMTSAQIAGVAYELVSGELKSEDGEAIDAWAAETLVEILVALGGDPLAYPLGEEDLDLYDVALLRDMIRSLRKTPGFEKATKAECIEFLVPKNGPGWLPSEFAAILTPAKAAKPQKGKAKAR